MPPTRSLIWLLSALGIALAQDACAGDWPQVLGPHRDGVADSDERVELSWPESGPQVVWERAVGDGVAGVAVAGEVGVLFHREGDQEVVEGFVPGTGKSIWRDSYETTFRPQVGGQGGPLSVPAIAGNWLVTFGPQGVLSCYELESGALQWRRRTHDDFDAREGYFGAGSSPLIWNDRVIVNVGGFRSQASVVAFNLEDGDTLWHVLDDHASYSSPRMMTYNEQPLIVAECRLQCIGIEPESGEIAFQFPFGMRGPTVNGANPLVVNQKLFLTASYGIGGLLVGLDQAQPRPLWRGDDLYSSQYCTPVFQSGVLYGVDGRQDGPPGDLKCFDPLTQRTFWTEPGFGYGTLILADGKLLILRTDGTLVLASANRERYDQLAEARVLSGTARALPALAEGRLFVRDEATLKCIQVGPAAQ